MFIAGKAGAVASVDLFTDATAPFYVLKALSNKFQYYSSVNPIMWIPLTSTLSSI